MIMFVVGVAVAVVFFSLVYAWGTVPAFRDEIRKEIAKERKERDQIEDEVTRNMLTEIANTWIGPLDRKIENSNTAHDHVFTIYNRKIERLEKMFVALGHGDILEELCKIEVLADENAKKITPPKKVLRKLDLVKTKD